MCTCFKNFLFSPVLVYAYVLLLHPFRSLTQVVEFDEPSKLLANENSRFCAMLAAVENKISVRG